MTSSLLQITVLLEDDDNPKLLKYRIDQLVAEIRREARQARRKAKPPTVVRGWSQQAIDSMLAMLVAERRGNYVELMAEIVRRNGTMSRADLLKFLGRDNDNLQGFASPVIRIEGVLVERGELDKVHDQLLAPAYPQYGGKAMSYGVPRELFGLLMNSPLLVSKLGDYQPVEQTG